MAAKTGRQGGRRERAAHPRPRGPAAPHGRRGGAALDADRPPLLRRRHPDPDHLRSRGRHASALAKKKEKTKLGSASNKGGGEDLVLGGVHESSARSWPADDLSVCFLETATVLYVCCLLCEGRERGKAGRKERGESPIFYRFQSRIRSHVPAATMFGCELFASVMTDVFSIYYVLIRVCRPPSSRISICQINCSRFDIGTKSTRSSY
jgi:hypothetical protein